MAAVYNDVHGVISREPVRDYVPDSWISLVLVKREHHLALSHKHCAAGLLGRPIADFRTETKLTLEHIQESDGKTQIDYNVPKDDKERLLLGRHQFLSWVSSSNSMESLVRNRSSFEIH